MEKIYTGPMLRLYQNRITSRDEWHKAYTESQIAKVHMTDTFAYALLEDGRWALFLLVFNEFDWEWEMSKEYAKPDLIALGVITEEEWEAEKAAKTQEEAQRAESFERRLARKLIEKYPDIMEEENG